MEFRGVCFKTLGLGLVVCLLPACSRPPEDLRPTAEDIRIARTALSLKEVSLMLRTGSSQSELVPEIKRRRVPEKIDGAMEDKLIASGANALLIATLKTAENVLTPKQKLAFDQYQAERASLAEEAAAARRTETATQISLQLEEQQRGQYLQVQTARNIAAAHERETSYEIAQRNYEGQRKSLELQIQSLQTQINRRRSHGWTEAELHVANQNLEELNKQLRDLTAPLR
jgi:hypothetical protein